MSTMTSVIGLGLIAGIFSMLVPIALLVVLQVWLCRKGKRLGLILPALSVLVSLLLVFSMAGFAGGGSTTVTSYGPDGQVVEERHEEHGHGGLTPGAVGSIAGLFLAANIPTAVFGGIWIHCRDRREIQDDLNRMKIEDLE